MRVSKFAPQLSDMQTASFLRHVILLPAVCLDL
jgi:hypothetical protein